MEESMLAILLKMELQTPAEVAEAAQVAALILIGKEALVVLVW
jgi:hypothetical protein